MLGRVGFALFLAAGPPFVTACQQSVSHQAIDGPAIVEADDSPQNELKGELLRGDYQAASELGMLLFVRKVQNENYSVPQRAKWLALSANASLLGNKIDRAEKILEYGSELFRDQSPVDAEITLEIQNFSAELLVLSGKFTDAENLLVSTLEESEKALGNDHRITLRIARNLGFLYSYYIESPKGDELLERVLDRRLSLFGEIHPRTAQSYNDLAWKFQAQDKLRDAEAQFRNALRIRKRLYPSDHPDVAETQADLAFILIDMDRTEEAKPLLAEAYSSRLRNLGDVHPKTIETTVDLATLYREAGDFDQSRELFKKAIVAYEELYGAETEHLHYPLNGLVQTLTQIGLYGEALEVQKRRLELTNSWSSTDGRWSAVYGNHCFILMLVGNYAEAEKLCLKSNYYNELREDPYLGWGPYSHLAEIYSRTDRLEQAIALHRRTLEARTQRFGAAHQDTIISRLYLARLLDVVGQTDAARSMFVESLNQIENNLGELHPDNLVALAMYGDFAMKNGDYETAEEVYQKVIGIGEAAKLPQNVVIAQAYAGYAQLYQNRPGDLEIATFFAKKAVEKLQSVRFEMSDFSTDLSSTFLLQYESEYLRLQELLIRQGRFAEAEQVGNMLKAKEYFEFVRRRSDAASIQSGLELTSLEAEWDAQIASWSERPNRIATELAVLKTKRRGGAELTALEQTQFDDLQTRYDVAYTEYKTRIDDWLASVGELSDDAIQREAEELQARYHDDLQLEIEEIGADVALFQLMAFEDSAHAFLITPGAFKYVEIPVARTELFQAIYAARRAVQPDPQTGELDPDAKVKLQALYEILMAPIEQELADAGTETLMLNLQGAIRYVPFAALYDGEAYLTERYKLAMFASAARTRYEPADALQEAAGFGVAMEHAPFRALPSVTRELASILGTGDEPGILTGPSYLDTAFTKAVFKSELEEERPIVHIASHFSMRPGNDSNSFLLLGDGTKLTLAEINETAAMRFRGVELLTLSACSTALSTEGSFGVDSGTGVEVEGFGVLAQRKGAKAVIASLWDVNDSSTADLMTELYANLSTGDLNKAEALQAAQKSMIRSADKNHPYYWAPFILMGNWK